MQQHIRIPLTSAEHNCEGGQRFSRRTDCEEEVGVMRCLHQFPWCCAHSWWASAHCGAMCVGALPRYEGHVWDWFLATPGVGCNCFRRGILRHGMRLERRTRSPDTDTASFSRMSAPFTLHARSVGWRLSPAALTSLSATGGRQGSWFAVTDGFYSILMIHSQN